MDKEHGVNIFRTYKLDYIGKYHFYEKDELIKFRNDGQYIMDNLDKSNRFDYDGASYTFTKFGNISEGKTEKGVEITINKDDYNVKINNEIVHLDLIYKMDIKELEDHFRITTRISEKGEDISCLLYINLNDGKDFINALNKVKENQIKLSKAKVEKEGEN
ncbi:hypothetical protein H8S20_05175 [Clostridium sp. NSJ-6]|uniref:Uncharacterized protein n=1 Tax=Clostridium hominis TaxID=2763036 RepID=A0ABR7DAC6_9CLOT|nr:hypothetical protein [Clostridium hominis]MBC5628282.1 hypothetical protein [Clostridium hominis]MDU2671458.1 hypothetical protein [Clostridium sp.]